MAFRTLSLSLSHTHTVRECADVQALQNRYSGSTICHPLVGDKLCIHRYMISHRETNRVDITARFVSRVINRVGVAAAVLYFPAGMNKVYAYCYCYYTLIITTLIFIVTVATLNNMACTTTNRLAGFL